MSLYGDVTEIRPSDGAATAITVPSLTTVYSRSFRLNYGQAFGIWLQAGNGSGAANMKIQLEQSRVAPAVQGASDANYVIGEGVADIFTNLNDASAHVKTVQPVPMKYARLKITGLGSNPADATLTAWIFIQELIA